MTAISELVERVLDAYGDEREDILDDCEITAERLAYILIKEGYINEENMPWVFEGNPISEPSSEELEQMELPFEDS